eukprot:2459544-Pyramimonas_sp.AAC.1
MMIRRRRGEGYRGWLGSVGQVGGARGSETREEDEEEESSRVESLGSGAVRVGKLDSRVTRFERVGLLLA